jgi:hypothetical protein
MTKFKHLGMTVTNENYIYEEINWTIIATIHFRVLCTLVFGLKT